MRKFREYWVNVEFPNGNYETISYIDDIEIDKSNYSEMLEVYRRTKEHYDKTKCEIKFMGKADDSEFVEMFSKIMTASEVCEESSISCDIENIYNSLILLKEKLNSVKGMVGASDKAVSAIEHEKFECSDKSIVDDKFKIKAFNELNSALLARRYYKSEYAIAHRSEVSVVASLSMFEELVNGIDKIETKQSKATEQIQNKKGKAYEKNMVKEYPYKNGKDRINLMSQIEKKYDEIANDVVNKKLVCYNKVYK